MKSNVSRKKEIPERKWKKLKNKQKRKSMKQEAGSWRIKNFKSLARTIKKKREKPKLPILGIKERLLPQILDVFQRK